MYDKFKYNTYDEYIAMQVKHIRTLYRTIERSACRNDDISLIKVTFPWAKKVICVGARDKSEVDAFTEADFEATGIDVYSASDKIQIVDMHKLSATFLHHEFDIAYMSHSLEHSYDPVMVLNEVKNVCSMGCFIIVPVMKAPTMKDPVVFNFMKSTLTSIEDIQQDFDALLTWKLQVNNVIHRRPTTVSATDEIVIIATFG